MANQGNKKMKYSIEIEVFDKHEEYLINCLVYNFVKDLAEKSHTVITAGYSVDATLQQDLILNLERENNVERKYNDGAD